MGDLRPPLSGPLSCPENAYHAKLFFRSGDPSSSLFVSMDFTVSRFMSSRRIATVLLITYWIAMFVGTHIPIREGELPELARTLAGVLPLDKVVHFSGYFGLAFLLAWVLIGPAKPHPRTLAIILFVAVFYAAMDEVTQDWVETRTSDVLDWLADSAGATAGLVAYLVLNRHFRRRRDSARASLAKSDHDMRCAAS
jgi:hypothetical protein